MRRLLALAFAIVLAVTACSKTSEDSSSPLYKVILDTPPKGFQVVKGPASGPMDIDQAAKATAVESVKMKSFLRRSGYQLGYSRVWTGTENKDDYITVLVYEFATAQSAKDLVTFEVGALESKRSYQAFSVTGINGAAGYILSATKGNTSQAVFCQTVLFPKGDRAYHVSTCSAQPNSGEAVKDLAKDQEAKAAAHT